MLEFQLIDKDKGIWEGVSVKAGRRWPVVKFTHVKYGMALIEWAPDTLLFGITKLATQTIEAIIHDQTDYTSEMFKRYRPSSESKEQVIFVTAEFTADAA